MEAILTFLENNYIWFLVAAVVLLLALIGFVVDSKRKQKKMEGKTDIVSKTVTPEMSTPVASGVETMTSTQVMPEANAQTAVPFEEVKTESIPVTSETLTFNDVPSAPTPVETPIMSTLEQAPIVETPIMPTLEQTPIVETPIMPTETVVATPVIEQTPIIEPTPVVETPIFEQAPVMESTSAVENVVQNDFVGQTPVVEPIVNNNEEQVININE